MRRGYLFLLLLLPSSAGYTLALAASRYRLPLLSPFGERGLGPAANAGLFLAATAAFALLLLALTRRPRLMHIISYSMVCYAAYVTALVYVDAVASPGELWCHAAGAVAVAAVALAIRVGGPAYSVALTLVMSGLGVLLSSLLGLATKVLMLVCYSAFDIYSVYRGPVRRMLSGSPGGIEPFTAAIGGLRLGAGDMIFYSMLVSLSAEVMDGLSPIGYLLAAASISAGHAVNLRLLSSRRVVPALPAPTCLCLSSLAAAMLLRSVLHDLDLDVLEELLRLLLVVEL